MPTPIATMTPHRPCRPGWDCLHCERPWPCAEAKGDLAVEFEGQPVHLLYYMAAQMVQFMADVGETREVTEPDACYPRFIEWVFPATAVA